MVRGNVTSNLDGAHAYVCVDGGEGMNKIHEIHGGWGGMDVLCGGKNNTVISTHAKIQIDNVYTIRSLAYFFPYPYSFISSCKAAKAMFCSSVGG